MNRAYSLIETKALDEGRRVFTGWATTPEPDRVQDSIDPMGAVFKNPLVLLHHHNHEAPIGNVRFDRPTAKGIRFEAEIPAIAEPGLLKDRVDLAWGEIKHGLVRAVSVGFRPTEKPVFNKDGGFDFPAVEIYELSLVSVPANSEALIDEVKSIDRELRRDLGLPVDEPIQLEQGRAASGKSLPVVKLNGPARVRAKPFVIQRIHT